MIKKILLVDDDIALRNSISAYLISEGFIIFAADSVYNAFILIKTNMPDLIIADIMMPGADGYDFISMLRSDHIMKTVPIIFLTAKGMTDDRIKGYNLGCNAYLTKPFNPRELVSIINNLLQNIELRQKDKISVIKQELELFSNAQQIINSLTYRELTILELVVKGFMNKEIAVHLNVSTRNVEKYVSRLLSKTSTRNRTELAQFVISSRISLPKGE